MDFILYQDSSMQMHRDVSPLQLQLSHPDTQLFQLFDDSVLRDGDSWPAVGK